MYQIAQYPGGVVQTSNHIGIQSDHFRLQFIQELSNLAFLALFECGKWIHLKRIKVGLASTGDNLKSSLTKDKCKSCLEELTIKYK